MNINHCDNIIMKTNKTTCFLFFFQYLFPKMKAMLGDCNGRCFKFHVMSQLTKILYTLKYKSEVAVVFFIKGQQFIRQTVGAKGDIGSLYVQERTLYLQTLRWQSCYTNGKCSDGSVRSKPKIKQGIRVRKDNFAWNTLETIGNKNQGILHPRKTSWN